MRAVVWTEAGTVGLDDVPEPHLEEATDAVVRITRSGICGSDLHVFEAPALLPGETLGHEFVGVVEEVGGEVTRIQPGDRVVGSCLIPCGGCDACARQAYNVCPDRRSPGGGVLFGSLGGAQAERIRVPNADLSLLPVPDGLHDEQALFVGDILTTAYYASRLGDVGPGRTVVVQGCGPVGLLAVQVARALGADSVWAVDLVAERVAAAEGLGASGIDAGRRNPGMTLERELGSRADVVVDTAGGAPAAFLAGLDLVRPGGTVAVVGLYVGLEVPVPLHELFWTNITIRFGGLCPVPALWHDTLAMVERGAVDPAAIISHRLPLEEAVRGYELFRARQATKVVLAVEGSR